MPHPSVTVYDMTSTTTTTAAAPLVAHGRIEAVMPRNIHRAERVANSDPRIALLNADASVVRIASRDENVTAYLIANRSRGAMRYTVNGATYLVIGTPTSFVERDTANQSTLIVATEPHIDDDSHRASASAVRHAADADYYGIVGIY